MRGGYLSGLVLEHGFDFVYDAVCSSQTLDDATRMTRPGGRIVLVGTSTRQSMDWSLVWHRELTVAGSVFPLDEAVEDLATSAAGPSARAVKVAFAPSSTPA